MAVIPHRFIDRLTPLISTKFVDILVIGTFNPGLPNPDTMSETDNALFQEISETKKFKRFNEVRNYYDRPQNRFWKVMDVINSPAFYDTNLLSARNPNSLKFYKGMDRQIVFQRQQLFCQSNGLFITDIVRNIKTNDLDGVYNNFADTVIEKSVYEWNTKQIDAIITDYNPRKVIINFSLGKTIPTISRQIESLKLKHKDIISHAVSTSGAAGNTYKELISHWSRYFIANQS